MRKRSHTHLCLAVLLLLALRPGSVGAQPIRAPKPHDVCLRGTCVDAHVLPYWTDNGGLAVFGYPTTPARQEVNRDRAKTYLTQWFERARFEWHPGKPAAFRVLLGLLGNEARRGPEDAWARARRLLPAAVPIYKPAAAVPPRFGRPVLAEARIDPAYGPVYTVAYPGQNEALVFILGVGAGAYANTSPPDARAPIMVHGVAGQIFTSTGSPHYLVSWQEGQRSYQVAAYGTTITRAELLRVVQSLVAVQSTEARRTPRPIDGAPYLLACQS